MNYIALDSLTSYLVVTISHSKGDQSEKFIVLKPISSFETIVDFI